MDKINIGKGLRESFNKIDSNFDSLQKKKQNNVSVQIDEPSSPSSGDLWIQGAATAALNRNVPSGAIFFYAGNKVPDGWLLCDGSSVSIADYNELYMVIGTTYGTTDDPSTTFKLPNLINLFPQGSTSPGEYKQPKLPNIKGQAVNGQMWGLLSSAGADSQTNGAFYRVLSSGELTRDLMDDSSNGPSYPLGFDASKFNSIYSDDASNTVQPPALTLLAIIKY